MKNYDTLTVFRARPSPEISLERHRASETQAFADSNDPVVRADFLGWILQADRVEDILRRRISACRLHSLRRRYSHPILNDYVSYSFVTRTCCYLHSMYDRHCHPDHHPLKPSLRCAVKTERRIAAVPAYLREYLAPEQGLGLGLGTRPDYQFYSVGTQRHDAIYFTVPWWLRMLLRLSLIILL